MLLHREVVDPVDEVKESEEDQEVSEDGLGCALVIPLRQNENSRQEEQNIRGYGENVVIFTDLGSCYI